MERVDYFSIYELYFLLDAFGGKILMGLPNRADMTISSESVWETAKDALVEKHLVNVDGSLTEAGFVMTEVMKEYCTGDSLTIINNWYIMHSAETNFSIVIVDNEEGYQVLKLSPLSLLSLLQNKLPIFLREPQAGEDTFLSKEIPLTENLEEVLMSDDTLVIQYYPLLKMVQSKYAKQLFSQLLFVEFENKLLGYYVSEEQLFQYSQYYFLHQLYTWLHIPFREEDFN